MQTTFLFVIDAPAADLNGSQVLIAADDAEHADRLAAVRSTIFGAPLRRCGVIEVPRVRGAA